MNTAELRLPTKTSQSAFRLSSTQLSLLTLSTILLIWWAITGFDLIGPLFLPSPQQVLTRFWLVVTDGYMDATLWQHLAASLSRIGLALVAALLVALPLGMLIGHYSSVKAVFDPLIEFYRPIPPLAYLPLIVIWFGIGEFSKMLLIYLAIFAPLTIATAEGVRRIEPNRLRAAQSLGANQWQLFRYVILPGALPDILTGLRIGLGVGWSTLVASELVAATEGLGFMVQSAAQFLATDVVLLGILVIAIVASLIEFFLRKLQRKLTPWHGQHH